MPLWHIGNENLFWPWNSGLHFAAGWEWDICHHARN